MSTRVSKNLVLALPAVAIWLSISSTAVAQLRAVLPGERIISVGRTIDPAPKAARPCTIDCEKAAAKAQLTPQKSIGTSVLNSKPATDPCEKLKAENKELLAKLTALASKSKHEMTQQSQQIERLSQMVKNSELQARKAASQAKAAAELEKTVAEHKEAMEIEKKKMAQEIGAKIAEANKKMEESFAKSRELERSKVELEAELKKRKSEIAELGKRLSAKQAKDSEVAAMKKKFAMAEEALTMAHEKTEALEKEIAKHMETQAEMNKRMATAKRQEQEAAKMSKTVTSLREELEHAHERHEGYEKSAKKMKAEIEALKRRLQGPRKGKGKGNKSRPEGRSASDRDNDHPRRDGARRPSAKL